MSSRQHRLCCCGRGFTLVEMAVTLSILAILLGIGIPAFSKSLAAWQRDRATKALIAHMQLARTEAIKRTRRVVICNSSDASTCSAPANKDWKNGWIVFEDDNANGLRDAAEPLMAASGAFPGIQSMQANNAIKRLVYQPNGLMTSGMSTMSVTPRAGPAQKIVINRIGRVRLDQ